MRKFTAILFLLGLHFIALGQRSSVTCTGKASQEIKSITADTFNDLQFLKDKIKNKRVVLLGENSHTVGDYYLLKTRLVKFLHQQCGFTVFAMESGIADVFTVYAQIDTLAATALMKKTLFANLSCNEMKLLFEYLKSKSGGNKQLSYYGFDSQNHGPSLTLIKQLLHEQYGTTSDSLIENMNKYFQIPQLAWQPDKAPVSKLADTIRTSAAQLIEMFSSIKPELKKKKSLSDLHIKILERSLHNHKDAVSLNWYTESPLEKRDSLMAENIAWLADEVFPGKKIIIWAHNTHIDKGGTDAVNKSMGYYLHQRMKNNTYHIGLYARTGELYWWWTKNTRSFNSNEKNDIETIADRFPVTFIDITGKGVKCPSLNNPLMGYEAEFGRKVSFIPAKRYDAIINFRKVAASTY